MREFYTKRIGSDGVERYYIQTVNYEVVKERQATKKDMKIIADTINNHHINLDNYLIRHIEIKDN